jgi:hypothetical protein
MNDYKTVELQDFGSQWTRVNSVDVPKSAALLSTNCAWAPSQVSTRLGFGISYAASEAAKQLYYWIDGALPFLVYFTGTRFRITTTYTPFAISLYSQSAAGAVIAASGPRIYTATYDANMTGTGSGHVISGVDLSFVDKLFLGPLTNVPTVSNVSTGNVTAGAHRVGYILGTRNGYQGRISPSSGTTGFNTASAVNATGGMSLRFQLSGITWPNEVNTVYPVMTPASNLNRWFAIPNVSAAVTGGATTAVDVTFSISDDDLLAADVENEVTDHINLWTQDGSGNPPFSPLAIGEYGFRTWYVADVSGNSQLIVSDPEDPQHITADQHMLQLPGFRKIRGAFALGGMLYVGSTGWTYGYRDTGALPVEWPTPDLVDAQIGPYGPNCVTVSASQGFALVANPQGLWLFQGGSYATKPLTYYVDPDWKRINWTGGGVNVVVVDSKDDQRAYVMAPLDSATSNSHILTIDYTNGLTPETVKFSPWDLANAGYSTLGGGAVVINPDTQIPELWIGTATDILRQKQPTETHPYRDVAAGIDWQFETALLPGVNGSIFYHYCAQLRATGSGTLTGTVYGMDRTVNSGAWTQALSASPGKIYLKRYPRVRSESASYRFSNGAALDSYCVLSQLEHNFAPGPSFR